MYLNLSSETHKTELHWHREPELVYVIEGQAECPRNGETTLVNEGDFILFNSEDVHLVRPVVGTSVRLVCIQLSFEYMRMFCKSIDSVVFDLSVSPQTKQKLIEVLQEIAETNPNDEYSTLLQIAHVNKIYYLLLKNCTCFKRATNNPIIPRRDFSYAKTAIAYINENYKREIPLNEISSVVNLSPSYFSKYFKSITRGAFERGIGLAYSNPIDGEQFLVVGEDSSISVKILRGPAILQAGNSPKGVELTDGDEFTITAAREKARIYGLDEFRCQECYNLRRMHGRDAF